MGLSARAYARRRGVSHTAVQKALRAGRILALPDGTINATAADAAWTAAAKARRAAKKVPADPTRVALPAGSLATAEATVRAVLVEHGASTDKAITMADARLANAILQAKQRADAIAAHEVAYRLRQRAEAGEAIDKRLVDALITNAVQVICQYVDPRDVPAALDKLRALQARCVPGTVAEADLRSEELQGELQGAPPMPESCSASRDPAPDERPMSHLLADGDAGAEAAQIALQHLDARLAGGARPSSSAVEQVDATPEGVDRRMAAESALRCGTCVNMATNGWCCWRRFFVTPALPACEVYYEAMPADRSGQ